MGSHGTPNVAGERHPSKNEHRRSTTSSLSHLRCDMAPATQRQTTPAPRHLPGRKAKAVDPDRELLHFNVRLAKSRQALADTNRLERKAFREHARVENAVAAYTRELCSLLDERGFTKGVTLSRIPEGGDSVLIVQIGRAHV